MDEGIHDSINDLAKVLDDSVFRLVDEPDEAMLTLLVRGRGYGGTFGVGGVNTVGLIRFRGHIPKGGYDVHDGQNNEAPASAPAVN